MRLVKTITCAIALTAMLAPGARADEWNKKTFLTFSGPVQIPGATLAAGTYVFKLADLSGNRHVVQVFDKDEKHIYGTILAIPDKRLEPTDDPVVLFSERPAGTPQAIRAWFYPGDTFGDEFVYPKSQAMQIAKASHTSVLATEDEANANKSDQERMEGMKTARVGRVDENGRMTNDTGAPASQPSSTSNTPAAQQNRPSTTTAASTTASEDARLKNGSGPAARTRGTNARANQPSANRNAVGTSGQAATNTANAKRRSRLPQTGSELALFELLSGLSLAGAFGIRQLRIRFAGAR